MSDHHPTEASFLADVATHEIKIVRDDGVYRHIVFKRPGTRCYQFDLITWPGVLCYTGDMGTYVFQRLTDMFDLFRTSENEWNYKKNGLSISPGYWSDKLLATDNGGGHTEFDDDMFKRVVMDHLVTWIREHREQTTKGERRELWDEVIETVINAEDDSAGHIRRAAALDYVCCVNRDLKFSFVDFWEHRLQRLTYHFVWCCYAMAWGIQQYDIAKGKEDAA